MSTSLEKEPDYGILFDALVKKTLDGKLLWQPTADEKTFLAAVQGQRTFELTLVPSIEGFEAALASYGVPGNPVLKVRGVDGRLLLETPPSAAAVELYALARRVALRIDENIDSTMQLLEHL